MDIIHCCDNSCRVINRAKGQEHETSLFISTHFLIATCTLNVAIIK